MPVVVRPATPRDAPEWIRLRSVFWPESPEDHPREIAEYFDAPPDSAVCLVAESRATGIVGFVEVGLRSYAEGCASSPVGYLEGIFVVPERRQSGVGGRLVAAAEGWACSKGCTEMGSDRALGDEASGGFHLAVGYSEVQRIVCMRKELS